MLGGGTFVEAIEEDDSGGDSITITSSVEVPSSGWKKLLSFMGPGFMCAVGYLDPGKYP
jgi:hypothetical protein